MKRRVLSRFRTSAALLLLLFKAFLLVSVKSLSVVPTSSSSVSNKRPYRFVLLGGTGKIGTAVAQQILRREPESEIVLLGRNPEKGRLAVQEILAKSATTQQRQSSASESFPQISFHAIDDFWSDQGKTSLRKSLSQADALIHTAGPFGETETLSYQQLIQPLEIALDCQIPVYVDVADPLPYLERCLLLNGVATAAGSEIKTTCLLSAGAFPGMSNVLAIEGAGSTLFGGDRVQDLFFQYFTSGLGGSGPVNLYITNVGFGEPMVQYDQGELRWFNQLSGRLLGTKDFSTSRNTGLSATVDLDKQTEQQLQMLADRVGQSQVFAWPFPEAATVAKQLNIRGSSIACMGTAPEFWNTMLGILVEIVPRPLWRNHRFCKFLADFSEPLVKFSDWLLQKFDQAAIDESMKGETHAMRVDIRRRDGSGVSIFQAHDSFRHCVGQSCAEFALDCLKYPQAGVHLPEQRYREEGARSRIVEQLTRTPGTFCYSGPVAMDKIFAPSSLEEMLARADLQ